MAVTVRRLDGNDRDEAFRLGREAFGQAAGDPAPDQRPFPVPGAHPVGAYDGARLVAKLAGREYASWFAGTQVPTWGISGVTVEAESRGRGLLRRLLAVTFAEARERGMAISTLFPTAMGIYRGFGYEVVGDLVTVALPTAALAAVEAPPGVTVRRATVADGPAIRSLYAAWAGAQAGPLTRTGPSFPTADDDLIRAFTGITLASAGDGRPVGYASWDRGPGYDSSARIDVLDLIAVDGGATRALLATLGSFATVTGSVRIRCSTPDLWTLALPGLPATPVHHHPYMLRLLDVPAAVSARACAPGLHTGVAFTVAGDRHGRTDGGYRVEAAGGRLTCARADAEDAVTLSPTGLALLYAGVQPVRNLRLAGLAAGGDPARDADLDAIFTGSPFQIRDYF